MSREFTVVIERDEEGYLVASVPALPGCHTQARSMDELIERIIERIKEAIQLCPEVRGEETAQPAEHRRKLAEITARRGAPVSGSCAT